MKTNCRIFGSSLDEFSISYWQTTVRGIFIREEGYLSRQVFADIDKVCYLCYRWNRWWHAGVKTKLLTFKLNKFLSVRKDLLMNFPIPPRYVGFRERERDREWEFFNLFLINAPWAACLNKLFCIIYHCCLK